MTEEGGKSCNMKTAAAVFGAIASVAGTGIAVLAFMQDSQDRAPTPTPPPQASEVTNAGYESGEEGFVAPSPVVSLTNRPTPFPTPFPTPSPTSSPTSSPTVFEACTQNADCVLGVCAFESYTGAARLHCCPSGSAEFMRDYSYTNFPKSDDASFCKGQPAGARCPKNSLCESGICIFGFCEATAREAGETCQENFDCLSSVCVGGICQSDLLTASETCDDNNDCILGVCAYESYTGAAKLHCCPSGNSEFLRDYAYSNFPKNDDASFCKGQPTGARCPKDSLCASNNCTLNGCA